MSSASSSSSPFENGVMLYMVYLSKEELQRFKQLLVDENPRPGSVQITWDQVKTARWGEVVHLLMEYFPRRLAWDVTRDIFAKMNQTELCLQVQMELNDILPRLEPADANPREMPVNMEERESGPCGLLDGVLLSEAADGGADLRQVYPNATALFVQYLSSLFPTKAGGLPGNTHQEQLRGLCYLAAEDMWNMKWVFDPEDLEHAKLEETAVATFLRVNIFQRVAGDQDCYTFAFMSFQEFFAALWYVLSSPQRPRNFQVLDSVHVTRLIAYPGRKKSYLAPMGLFLFGLLNETCALATEKSFQGKLTFSNRKKLLKVAALSHEFGPPTPHHGVPQLLYCLHETQEEAFVSQILNDCQKAALTISEVKDMQVSAFCLKHCRHLRCLELTITLTVTQVSTPHPESLRSTEPESSDQCFLWWRDFCSVFWTHESLEVLAVTNTFMETDSARPLHAALRHPWCPLQKLIFRHVNPSMLNEDFFQVLIENRYMRHLEIQGTEVRCETTEFLCTALKYPQCYLQRLRLENCDLTLLSCTSLISSLKRNENLTHLSLAENALKDEGAKQLCSALQHSLCPLQRLVLRNCNLTSECCQEMASALDKNKNLRSLDLGFNSLKDDGVILLFEALENPESVLQILELERCLFTCVCCQAMASMLLHNQSLRYLDVSKNDIGCRGILLLQEAFQQHKWKARAVLETKQNDTAETMTRLEGPAVKNEVLRIIQDWSIEYWEEARWMEWSGVICSILPKNPLFHQNLSSQPCTKMREAKLPSFSNYGLQWCFKQLGKEEFQTFKELLMENTSELATCSFPWVEVNSANVEHLASLLHEHYRESLAWKISIHIFEKMNLSTLSEKARKEMKRYSLAEMPENSTMKNDQELSMKEVPEISQAIEQDGATAAEMKEQGNTGDYKSHVMTKFAMKLDAHHGVDNFAFDCPEMQILFDAFNPDQRGFRPHTVVLHGKSGIGKSALARKVLLYWARGELYQEMFSYVFFLHAREMPWMREVSFAELICREWPHSQVPVTEIMSQPERLLFVVDGFNDLDFAFKDADLGLCEDWGDKQPMSVLMHSLLKKVLLPEASLMITVRDTGIEKLKSMVLSPRYLLVRGISVEKRVQLLLKHMKNEHQKTKVLNSVVDNHPLFNECQVPILGWLTCEALNLHEASGKSLPPSCQTLTGLYTTFLFHHLTPRDPSQRCLSQEERATLKSLCRMAVQGVWNMKFVFYGDDLSVHGLRESELSALFHMNVLLRDHGHERCYTFLHPSIQEFCAALHYVLEGLEMEWDPYPVFMENIRSLMELRQISSNAHLLQMKRFLFGLMSKEVMGTLEVLLGCPVPLVVRQGLLGWISLLGQQPSTPSPLDFLDSFYCLFETQDEDFVCLALNSFQEVWLPMNRRMDVLVSSFCLRHCQYLRKIRMDVQESLSKDEFTEAQPLSPQGKPARRLADEWWGDLCFVLSTHPSLRQLDLSGSILSEAAMKTLCATLRQPTCKIQNLIFKGAEVTLGLRHLWTTLISNRNIKYLSLESTHLREEDLMMACKALRHPNCLLESLRLDHCGLNPTCCMVISQILLTSISLKSLSLVGNKMTAQGIKPLCHALIASQCTLQKLILGNCGLTAADCQDLASGLTSGQSLTHLCLSSNSLGSAGMNLLCRAMKSPNCGLQRLILKECNLDVAGCGFLAFALMGNRHLTHLSLSMNPLEDDGMNLLCEVMMEPSCHLQDLELVKCHLTATCCKNLSQVISRSKYLKSLDLAANALGDHGIVELCEGLKHKKACLRRLGLEACGLTSDCCEALASALLCSQRLTSLNLMRNNFSPAGMMKLCPAFAQPTSNLQIIGLWKWQYPPQIRKLLKEVQLLKPHIVIGDGWYSFDEDDRYWWKN